MDVIEIAHPQRWSLDGVRKMNSKEKIEKMTTDKNYEKITVNLPVVDLGKMDYLVSQGFYNSRAEFLRIAAKEQIGKNGSIFKALTEEHVKDGNYFVGIGAFILSREVFEKALKEGRKIKIFAMGMVKIANDVDIELISKTVKSFRAYGIRRGPPGVIEYLDSLKYIP